MTENEKYINKYLRWLQMHGYSQNTVKNYSTSLNMFLEFLGDRLVTDVTAQDIEDFQLYLYEKGISQRSIARHTAAVLSFYKFTLGMTFPSIRSPKFEQRLPEYLTREQVKQLIDSAKDLRDKVILALAYELALRRSELAALKLSDIDMTNRRVRIKGKGNKERILEISSEYVYKLLVDYINEYEVDDWLFKGKKGNHLHPNTIEEIFRETARKAGIILPERTNIHILRHSRATHMLEDGVSIFFIKEFLGHADISTTTIYLAITKKLWENETKKIEKVI